MTTSLAPKAVDRLETAIGSKRLGEIFLELGYLTAGKLEYALAYQEQKGGRLGGILAALGYISRLELYEGLAKHFSLPFETDTAYIRRKLDINAAITMTRAEMGRYQVVPFQNKGKTLTVLTAEPYSQSVMELLKRRFGMKTVNQIVVTDLAINDLSRELYQDDILDMSNSGLRRNPPASAGRLAARTIAPQKKARGIKKEKMSAQILPVPDVSELVVIKRSQRI